MGQLLKVARRYRVAAFGRPHAPWRDGMEEALDDAIALGLVSWDASCREWFLAAPGGLARKAA